MLKSKIAVFQTLLVFKFMVVRYNSVLFISAVNIAPLPPS